MPPASNFRLALPRRLRGAMVMFVLATYLFGGLMHGLCDLDVTSVSGEMAISLADKTAGHSEKGAIADHHCHGCFSVSVSAPLTEAADMMPMAESMIVSEIGRRGLPSGIDPPPPKFLT